MNVKSDFQGKNKQNITNLQSVEFALRVVKVNFLPYLS